VVPPGQRAVRALEIRGGRGAGLLRQLLRAAAAGLFAGGREGLDDQALVGRRERGHEVVEERDEAARGVRLEDREEPCAGRHARPRS